MNGLPALRETHSARFAVEGIGGFQDILLAVSAPDSHRVVGGHPEKVVDARPLLRQVDERHDGASSLLRG